MPNNFNEWGQHVKSTDVDKILKIAGKDKSEIGNMYSFLNDFYDANIANKDFFAMSVQNAVNTVDDFISKYGTSTKSPNAWYNGLTQIQKAEAKALKDQSGLTWNEWYEKNIYNGDGSNLGGKKKAVGAQFNSTDWYEVIRKNNLGTMESWCDDWLKAISHEERNGVEVYTGSAYRDMNSYLRGQSSSTFYADEIKKATAALKKASLPEEVIVRRGSDYNMLRELGTDISEANKDKFVGAIVTDKGFMSTSPASDGGFDGDIEYVIKVPKGSQAMYVDTISLHRGEEELLINRGGKYIIEDVEFNSYGDVKKIYMTLKNLKGPK